MKLDRVVSFVVDIHFSILLLYFVEIYTHSKLDLNMLTISKGINLEIIVFSFPYPDTNLQSLINHPRK